MKPKETTDQRKEKAIERVKILDFE